MKINPIYKIDTFGKYHRGITDCPHCGEYPIGTLVENICGFYEHIDLGTLAVILCPHCFEKWAFHACIGTSTDFYQMFLDCIEDNPNFKKGV